LKGPLSGLEKERRNGMDSTTLIRIIAAVCFLIVLAVLIQRHRSKKTLPR
jgi:hypothetical protein